MDTGNQFTGVTSALKPVHQCNICIRPSWFPSVTSALDLHGSPALLWFSRLVCGGVFSLLRPHRPGMHGNGVMVMAMGSPPPSPASRLLPGQPSFSPGAGQRERASMDGANQTLLGVQEGGTEMEAAPPRREDPRCGPAGQEHLLTTEYWKHLSLWQSFIFFLSAK